MKKKILTAREIVKAMNSPLSERDLKRQTKELETQLKQFPVNADTTQVRSFKNDPGTRGAPGNAGHYDGEVQPIDLAFAQNLNYSEGSAVKYICRWRRKGNGVVDLRKAIWHLEQLIKQEEKNA